MIRLAFFGSPDFALPALQKLAADERFQIILVVTQPDRPAGRGQQRQMLPVKNAALDLGLPVLDRLPTAAELQKLNIAKIVVVAYGRILPAELTDNWECINLHPSLLPKHRGPSPLQTVLWNGEEKTGVTTMLLNSEMDAGDILLQEEISVGPNMQIRQLSALCAARGADLLAETLLQDIQQIRKPQNPEAATYCRKINKTDALITRGESPRQIHNKVRAFGGYVLHKGKRVKILETRYTAAGLEIMAVQPAGKQPMAYADFCRGYGEIIL
ncbi:methionyl-tRNA formyltransferase [Candidatus Termititenax aidoneus]|uniref:Methionyl-tRNA formyltransferase n=1 Tax=Termititenax aidoneus TaxID=2218524 RepID=A0A388TB63_TERA1|nr:methionyl-tRNA formyltransferase [Candidatus Termititenax aidoneus]